MIDYQSSLLGRTEVAEGTMAFQFEKPNNFVFKAGQYIDLTLSGSQPQLGPSDGMTHTFSIASSPSDKELVVTTRMRNTVFKQAISSLPIGSRARIEGPMGSFSLHKNTARPAVFLAGGIGIAPFLSMLSYVTEEKLRHPIVLLWRVKDPIGPSILARLPIGSVDMVRLKAVFRMRVVTIRSLSDGELAMEKV